MERAETIFGNHAVLTDTALSMAAIVTAMNARGMDWADIEANVVAIYHDHAGYDSKDIAETLAAIKEELIETYA